MHFQRQSSTAVLGGRFPAGIVAGVICLFATTTAFGQLFPNGWSSFGQRPRNAEMQAMYSPQQPTGQAWGGGYDPQQAMMYPQGMPQPGEMNYSQALEGYGGDPGYGPPLSDPAAGGQGSIPVKPNWLRFRDVQNGVYLNEEQYVINAGTTLELFTNDRFGSAARVLLGRAQTDHYRDGFAFTGDVQIGSTILFDGEHWLKTGVLWDSQDNFQKYGPVFGAMLFADRKHPVSIDLAYGIGQGDAIPRYNTLTTIADHDYQARVGTYITPNLQLGFSGNWLTWNNGRFQDYDSYGGFLSLNYGRIAVTADYSYGDNNSRGFVHVAYTFGGRRSRLRDGWGQIFSVENPRDWLTRPVIRDVSLQLQRAQ